MTLDEFMGIVYTVLDDVNQFKAWMSQNGLDPNQDRSQDEWYKLWARYVNYLYTSRGH